MTTKWLTHSYDDRIDAIGDRSNLPCAAFVSTNEQNGGEYNDTEGNHSYTDCPIRKRLVVNLLKL